MINLGSFFISEDLIQEFGRTHDGDIPYIHTIHSGMSVISEENLQKLVEYFSKSKKSIPKQSFDDKFSEFWSIYPKRNGVKAGKVAAQDRFKKLNPEDVDQVIIAAKNYGINNGFPKDPAGFLHKDFWRDWVNQSQEITESKPIGRKSYADEQADNLLAIIGERPIRSTSNTERGNYQEMLCEPAPILEQNDPKGRYDVDQGPEYTESIGECPNKYA